MASKTLQDLFIHSLSDVYSAEKQLTRALPKMARASHNANLRAAFETHLEETRGQVERIDQVVESCGIKLKRINASQWKGSSKKGKNRSKISRKGRFEMQH